MRLTFLPLVLLCVLFTGCIDIVENLVLDKKGSGKYSLTIDMSGLMKDPMMKGLIDAGDGKDNLKDMDSVIHFRDLPDSVKKDNPDFWNRVTLRIFSNAKAEQLYTKVNLDFKSVDEITYLVQNFNKVMENAKAGPLATGGSSTESGSGNLLAENLTYELKGKVLSRTSGGFGKTGDTGGEMEMMKTFLGDAKYTIYYTLPGKIKTSDITNATIDGNKMTIIAPLLDLMDNKVSLNGRVSYK